MKISLKKIKLGEDYLLILTGGNPHVGCVVVAEPGKKIKKIVFGTHKEHVVAVPLAKRKAEELNAKVVCVAGIHFKNATKKQVEEVIKKCEEL